MVTTLIQFFSIVGRSWSCPPTAQSQYAGMRADGIVYGLLNLSGSTLLAVSALTPPNPGVLLVEGAWALMSLGVTVRALQAPESRRDASIPPD